MLLPEAGSKGRNVQPTRPGEAPTLGYRRAASAWRTHSRVNSDWALVEIRISRFPWSETDRLGVIEEFDHIDTDCLREVRLAETRRFPLIDADMPG
ncbi:hypothetical protein EB231_32395 [Mesorhizobium sp. NZP2298]|nr:hypothetical protein EB231_32395 [Mesorhizobium sp. NZP2298]